MKTTLEEVKKAIAEGKAKAIYYSSHTLWWTHSEVDLVSATAAGRRAQEARHHQMMNDPEVPQEHKDRMQALMNVIKDSASARIPLDPTGAPLMQTYDPAEWIAAAEKLPAHFGKHGLKALMQAHHDNCGGNCWPKWELYNLMIDSHVFN